MPFKVIYCTDNFGAFVSFQAHAMVGDEENASGFKPVFKAIPSFPKLLKRVIDNPKLDME